VFGWYERVEPYCETNAPRWQLATNRRPITANSNSRHGRGRYDLTGTLYVWNGLYVRITQFDGDEAVWNAGGLVEMMILG
jgi:hypothetical protein